MLANSLPSPARRERLRPTRPLGWGVGALASKVAGNGRVHRVCDTQSCGPNRKAPQALVAATSPEPTCRLPHRRDCTPMSSLMTAPPESAETVRANIRLEGAVGVHPPAAMVTTACSMPGTQVMLACHVVA